MGQQFSQVTGGPDPMGLCLLLYLKRRLLACVRVLQHSLPPLLKVSAVVLHTDYQCAGCRVVDCGGLARVTTSSGDGFPPGSVLRHPLGTIRKQTVACHNISGHCGDSDLLLCGGQ